MSKLNSNIKLNLDLYRKLYLIRKAEIQILRYYPENEMKTPMHMSIGEEAIPVGVCQALKKDDQVFGTHRSHALYLAKTGETDKFFAELYGKETGVTEGKAGSMHLSFPTLGLMGASAIVGSIIPVAVGASFANKRKKNGKIVAVFFGDGAIDSGTFWESLNFACLMRLPILFVCEDNDLAVHTAPFQRHSYKSIADIAPKFNCHVFKKNTTDAEIIYKLASKSVELIRKTQRPSFLYLRYYRYLEHVGINEDFDAGYRSRDEFEKWYKKDPVDLGRKKLLKLGIKEEEIIKHEKKIDNQIERSIQLARKSPFVDISRLHKDTFYERT